MRTPTSTHPNLDVVGGLTNVKMTTFVFRHISPLEKLQKCSEQQCVWEGLKVKCDPGVVLEAHTRPGGVSSSAARDAFMHPCKQHAAYMRAESSDSCLKTSIVILARRHLLSTKILYGGMWSLKGRAEGFSHPSESALCAHFHLSPSTPFFFYIFSITPEHSVCHSTVWQK